MDFIILPSKQPGLNSDALSSCDGEVTDDDELLGGSPEDRVDNVGVGETRWGGSLEPGQRLSLRPWVFIFPSSRTWIVRPQTAHGAELVLSNIF